MVCQYNFANILYTKGGDTQFFYSQLKIYLKQDKFRSE